MSHARETVSKRVNAALPTRYRPRARVLWGGSPLFRVEDEGNGRNDVRRAHTRLIVAKEPVELPSGQMLPRRRDRAGTGRWRSLTPFAATCPTRPAAARLKICSAVWEKSGFQSGPLTTLPTPFNPVRLSCLEAGRHT